jgi:NADH:ubiquinone reductase (H+-translocating)
MSAQIPHVVIVGGGFGGLEAAKALADAPVRVTLIDAHNHHLFQPLLYQVATAALAAPDIAAPIRRILRSQKNVTVLLDRVSAVDLNARRLHLTGGPLDYDHLILAAGAVNNYFGNNAWAKHAPGLKTLTDALDIRRRILLAFEAAEKEPDPARRAEWLTFAVIGGGPTGVELAGSIAEIARNTLARDFRNFDPRTTRVVLIEGGDRVLTSFTAQSSEAAAEQLRRLGVELRFNARVTNIDETGVSFGADKLIARTVLWGAGVRGAPLAETLGVPLDRAGRVLVEADLSLPGHPEVSVVGDLAAAKQADGSFVPGVAQGAMQGGALAAKNLLHRLAGRPTEPFVYNDKGSMATIGRKAAVAEIGALKLRGLPAWAMWLFIHILFLVGFRNRIAVLSEWAWAYVSYQRSARVIVSRSIEAPTSTLG